MNRPPIFFDRISNKYYVYGYQDYGFSTEEDAESAIDFAFDWHVDNLEQHISSNPGSQS